MHVVRILESILGVCGLVGVLYHIGCALDFPFCSSFREVCADTIEKWLIISQMSVSL